MSPFQTVLTTLPALTTPELEEVKAKAQALLSLSAAPGTPSPTTATDDWLLQGIAHVLCCRGLLGKYFPTPDNKTYTVVCQVQTTLLAAIGRPLKTVEKVALGRVVAEAMADMISAYAPLGPKIMLQHIPKAAQALENSFPGYLAAGMVGKLIQQLGSHGRAHQGD